jgi:hydroxymethylpyrimidine/phosphomethylpyrimidine kinase
VAVTTLEVPHALTIAGSDSGGGAGIQADLKTFAAFGVYGTSAITAVTAQNTLGVTGVQEIDLDVIAAQIDAVVTDIGVDVVKTGMLSSAAITSLVAEKARQHRFPALVVDPVMIAASGARLLKQEAVNTIRNELLPQATVVTPNIPEAVVLADMEINDRAEMETAARRIHAMGPQFVVVKGGHLESSEHSDDILFDGHDFIIFPGKRIHTTSNHGTGCTFASAVASGIAHGRDVQQAVAGAKSYVTAAIANAFPVGSGHGPLNHFHHFWNRKD